MSDTDGLKPRKKPAQQRSRAMVDRLLESTAQLLIEEGYRHISTNRIAKHAGVSVGSLYQYFPNKDAMVLALFQRVCERQMSVIAEKLAEMATRGEDKTLEDAVRALVNAIIEAWHVEPELGQVLLREVTHLEEFHMLRAWIDRICEMVAGSLELHKDEIRPEDPHLAAYIVVNAVNGVLFSAELDRAEMLSDRRFADEICELAIRYLRRD